MHTTKIHVRFFYMLYPYLLPPIYILPTLRESRGTRGKISACAQGDTAQSPGDTRKVCACAQGGGTQSRKIAHITLAISRVFRHRCIIYRLRIVLCCIRDVFYTAPSRGYTIVASISLSEICVATLLRTNAILYQQCIGPYGFPREESGQNWSKS